ncbi:hypothetical protein HMPREF1077_02674 [Parabacteroides johnsonii CL02T12C29]|uniref:Uncharacterized protein n=1 Tax=Parabacteroides johnsonii CL02T12C29 TaxID=999419 RepID=K5Y388_9BACT|nr:hypothetical protein HMPREF1077_02674 [Parabacteroides johnsonii CL02T12C29]
MECNLLETKIEQQTMVMEEQSVSSVGHEME